MFVRSSFYHIAISIPAPARGRTLAEGLSLDYRVISIPAPARGRTHNNTRPRLYTLFQFPPPRGGELHFLCQFLIC